MFKKFLIVTSFVFTSVVCAQSKDVGAYSEEYQKLEEILNVPSNSAVTKRSEKNIVMRSSLVSTDLTSSPELSKEDDRFLLSGKTIVSGVSFGVLSENASPNKTFNFGFGLEMIARNVLLSVDRIGVDDSAARYEYFFFDLRPGLFVSSDVFDLFSLVAAYSAGASYINQIGNGYSDTISYFYFSESIGLTAVKFIETQYLGEIGLNFGFGKVASYLVESPTEESLSLSLGVSKGIY
jgi:hypothetical protein